VVRVKRKLYCFVDMRSPNTSFWCCKDTQTDWAGHTRSCKYV